MEHGYAVGNFLFLTLSNREYRLSTAGRWHFKHSFKGKGGVIDGGTSMVMAGADGPADVRGGILIRHAPQHLQRERAILGGHALHHRSPEFLGSLALSG